jgi:hypothetical protein
MGLQGGEGLHADRLPRGLPGACYLDGYARRLR